LDNKDIDKQYTFLPYPTRPDLTAN